PVVPDAGSTEQDATSPQPDAAPPADAGTDADADADAGEQPICTVPVGLVSEDGPDFKVYKVDVKLTGAAGTCVVHTSTQFEAPNDVEMQIGFLSGSPGYSANPRPDYQITSASPGTVVDEGEAANLMEGDLVTLT